jgi:hypothetical protein
LCLLLWQFGRQNKRRKKLLAVLRELTRGVSLGDPGSSMAGASSDALDKTRARLLKALEAAARALTDEPWTPPAYRADFARLADAIQKCRRRQADMKSEQLLDGFAGIVAEIRNSLSDR